MTPELYEMLSKAEQEMVPPELRAAGWIYRDMPGRCSPEMWEILLSIFGDGNYKIVVMSEGSNEHGAWKRGQFFLAPAAIENMKTYSAQHSGG